MIEVYQCRNHHMYKGNNVKRYLFRAKPFLVIMQLQLWLELPGFAREVMCFVS
jgi:hypothetical protein